MSINAQDLVVRPLGPLKQRHFYHGAHVLPSQFYLVPTHLDFPVSGLTGPSASRIKFYLWNGQSVLQKI